MSNPIALVVDDERDICQLLGITLKRMSIDADSAYTLQDAKSCLEQKKYDILFTDMRLPDGDGLDLISFVQSHNLQIPVAVITAHGNMETAIKALKSGAFDFISKPIDLGNLRNIIVAALKVQTLDTHTSKLLIGHSLAIEHLRAQIIKIARSQAPIYISGPSGCGKELVARIIHQTGPRHEGPFIPVNCGAISPELMESEFFGHLKGSFTGAQQDKQGFFQAADKGILFLDEVADLPLPMQVKLLRAIQEKSIRPVGAVKEIHVDVRILCATHKDLHELVKKNLFRHDLFYRLNVIEIKVPSLKERREDIIPLAHYILEKLAQSNHKNKPEIAANAIEYLQNYAFPGNVRELENILERAYTLSDGRLITLQDVQLPNGSSTTPEKGNYPLDNYLENVERETIIKALEACHNNKTKAAKRLGISFRTLRYRLKKLGLDNDDNSDTGP